MKGLVLVSAFSFFSSLFSFSLFPSPQPTFRATSELVVLHVSVRDRGGRYITGLTKDAFTVIDDAKPQTLEMFSADEVPASVGCGGLPRRSKLVPSRCSRFAMVWLTADWDRSSRSAARLKPPASITA